MTKKGKMYEKSIVCLANSVKTGGRCIAGKELAKDGAWGKWMRPVSARPKEELSPGETRCHDGRPPRVLDILSIACREPRPRDHQVENHLIDESKDWQRVGRVSWRDVMRNLDDVEGQLWVNGYSSYNGLNDRVPHALAKTLSSSLYLIQPKQLTLLVRTEGAEFGDRPRRRVRARFSLNGQTYQFSCTDPFVWEQYRTSKEGEYKIENGVVCVSLGELNKDGFCYKLAAAVLTRARAEKAL